MYFSRIVRLVSFPRHVETRESGDVIAKDCGTSAMLNSFSLVLGFVYFSDYRSFVSSAYKKHF